MEIREIDEKLIQEIEEYHKEVGIDKIFASSSIDLMNQQDFLYFIFLIHKGYKQKIAFDGAFIKCNPYKDVICKMKNEIRKSAETIKKVAEKV